MHPILENIKSDIYFGFGISEQDTTALADIQAIESKEESIKKMNAIMAKSSYLDEGFDEFLLKYDELSFSEYDNWLINYLKNHKKEIDSKNLNDQSFDKSSLSSQENYTSSNNKIVDDTLDLLVEVENPHPSIKNTPTENIQKSNDVAGGDVAGGDEQNKYTYSSSEIISLAKSVKNHLGGSLSFESDQNGFTLYNIKENEKLKILTKSENRFYAVPNKLLDQTYVNQCAEVIVKSSQKDAIFKIKVPASILEKDKDTYVNLMVSGLKLAGAEIRNIKCEGFALNQEQNKNNDNPIPASSVPEDNAASVPEDNAASPLKDRFSKYLDEEKKTPAGNPWIDFKGMCEGEGIRAINDMIDNDKGWNSTASISDKIHAINDFIQEMTSKDPDNFYGVVAIKGRNDDICFKPSTSPFVMDYVYGIEITDNQRYSISKLQITSSSIDGVISDLESALQQKRDEADKVIQQAYDEERHKSEPDLSPLNQYDPNTEQYSPINNDDILGGAPPSDDFGYNDSYYQMANQYEGEDSISLDEIERFQSNLDNVDPAPITSAKLSVGVVPNSNSTPTKSETLGF